MSTLEAILTRMMQDAVFAEAILSDGEQAITEYSLSAEEIAKFKSISHADFEALTSHAPEERRSLATASNNSGHMIVGVDRVEITR